MLTQFEILLIVFNAFNKLMFENFMVLVCKILFPKYYCEKRYHSDAMGLDHDRLFTMDYVNGKYGF